MSKFLALDLEAATSDFGNICEIGCAVFENGVEVWSYESLVCPIKKEWGKWQGWNLPYKLNDALRAPGFEQVWLEIMERAQGLPIVAHNAVQVERRHLLAAFDHIGKRGWGRDLEFVCSLEQARLAWPKLPKHGLKPLCRELNIDLDHHKALSDARACGEVMLRTGAPLI
ncbi:MAG: exonuclease domain-containing protein [Flavobacteriales bacterium]|jgi:DNA polymerase-3 subunit epsilon|nr:exonuclease domain-containing protein [Flavobacteriales bacterium]